MKDSPRGYNLHFNSVCLNFGLKLCISDECVYIKVESNDHRNKKTPTASLACSHRKLHASHLNTASIRTATMPCAFSS